MSKARVKPADVRPSKRLHVVEENTIRMMLADPRFTELIPCLRAGKASATKTRGCRTCARRAANRRAMHGLKSCLTTLTAPQRAELKRLLGVKQVRVILGGQHVTF